MKVRIFAAALIIGIFLLSVSYTIASIESNNVVKTAFTQLSIEAH